LLEDKITLAHGAGGVIMQKLIKDYIVKHFGGSKAEVPLEALDDASVIEGIVLKSDSHTVKPLFFPGGDIGRLAVSGTINDIAVMGAEPIALTSAFIIEEGFPISDFEKIIKSMKNACEEAEVYIITGDTKVMEKGSLEKFVVNTSGIGRRGEALEKNIAEVKKYRKNFNSKWLVDSNIGDGDKIIVSGTIGDHGVALLSYREGYGFESKIESDVAPLNKMIKNLLEVGGITKMKDPTRGGVSNALNEWSEKSKIGILIHEDKIPIKESVKSACEMLGIDPLEVGNEGKILIAVVPEKAGEVLEELRKHPEGKNAEIIGEATKKFNDVILETSIGGKRVLPPPLGDPVPRIC
jgi:hydrogenase expression/formation protein HypE